MKKYWRLSIILVGIMGILSFVFNEAFVSNPNFPFHSFTVFKYFTVQSNLVAVVYFCILIGFKLDIKSEKWKNLVGGVMIYTTITFLIFSIILEGLFIETGFTLIGSICLHYVNPLLIFGYVVYVRKEVDFQYIDSLIWVIYPILYLVFLVIWGVVTTDFIYPFFQVLEIGVGGLIMTIIGLVGLFFMLSFVVVKILSKK